MAETNSLLNCRTRIGYRGFESPSFRKGQRRFFWNAVFFAGNLFADIWRRTFLYCHHIINVAILLARSIATFVLRQIRNYPVGLFFLFLQFRCFAEGLESFVYFTYMVAVYVSLPFVPATIYIPCACLAVIVLLSSVMV